MVSVILIANDKQGNFTLSLLPVNQNLYEGVNLYFSRFSHGLLQ